MLMVLKNWKVILFFVNIIVIMSLSFWVSSLRGDVKDLEKTMVEKNKLLDICSETEQVFQDELDKCNDEFTKINEYYNNIQKENIKKNKKIKEIEALVEKLKKQECKCEKELDPELNKELIDFYNSLVKEKAKEKVNEKTN